MHSVCIKVGKMQILGLHHYSILVSDLEKAVYFYRDILGFTEIPRREMRYSGVWFSLAQQQLHLIAVLSAPKTIANHYLGQNDHLAFTVDHLDQLIVILEQNNIDYQLSTSGRKALFCQDFDNNVLEFIESNK